MQLQHRLIKRPSGTWIVDRDTCYVERDTLAMGWAVNLILVSISLFLILIVAEWALRWLPLPLLERVRQHQSVGKQIDEVHPKGLYSLHPEIGWTLTPFFAGRFKKEGFDISVQANSTGLRDHDYGEKTPGTFRILGLGDSFVFGWGVEKDQTFLKLLETKLNAQKTTSHFEVINAGIPGFGTYEALQLLKSAGLAYNPDLVVLAFYEGNDYRNNGDAPRSRVIQEGYLKDLPKGKRPAWRQFLVGHSVLAALVDARVGSVAEKRNFQSNLNKTESLFLEMKKILDERNIPLAVVFIPDQDPAFYDRPLLLQFYDRWVTGGIGPLEGRRMLRSFCREHGIGFCALSKKFENGAEAASLRLKDTHFNPKGHESAAQEIFEFLKGEVLGQGEVTNDH